MQMTIDDCALAPKLDPVRERFAQEYHATGNASEAYRRAKPHAAKWKESALNPKASRMLAEGKVRARLEELQAEAAKRHGTTIGSLTDELEKAREMAMNSGQPSAAVSATMGKAKLHGFLVDQVRADVKDHRDPHELSDAELMARIKKLEDSLALNAGKNPH
jgi:phage terminase small subunit